MRQTEATRTELLTAAAAQDWEGVLRLMETGEVPVEGDGEVAAALGRAAVARGRAPQFDADRLGRGVEYLSQAWRLGDWAADTLWPLVLGLYDLGRMEDAAKVLEAFVGEAPEAMERARAAAFGGQVLEVLGRYAEAIAFHQSGLSDRGEPAPAVVRFESYTNFHLARAYGRAGAATTWRDGALAAWEALSPEERTTARAVALLRAAGLAAGEGAAAAEAIGLGRRLIAEFPEPSDASLPDLSALCELHAEFMGLCDRDGRSADAEAALEATRALLARVRDRRAELQAALAECEDILRLQSQNLGYLCREGGRLEPALALMEEAASLPPVVGPTYFFLAALSLQVADDRAKSLEYLRRSAEDPFWVHDGACDSLRRAFEADPAFDAVRDDPEFLEAVGRPSADCAPPAGPF